MPETPTRNFRLSAETMTQLEAVARREGLATPSAAIRWLAARASRSEPETAAKPTRNRTVKRPTK